ncbi:hypothetical protein [Polycladomyces subterraneus]|uniref:Uncharacterized protein n=1 Tax=Polycladomyces subterraneus TaxID=1016997 RepID=A0ABT8IJV5_9BACL|nr:hypothetical protein [Polycladomyces subterraneus]MDN4593076.1 hypothetical protein [Polycladomyces subterraneus]
MYQRFALILTVGLLTAAVGAWTVTQWQGKTVNGETWILQGTLRYLDLEGGCWVLEDDTGKRFQLVGLPPSLLQNGVRLRLEVKKAERMMGKCQTGEFVRVLRVLQVQASQNSTVTDKNRRRNLPHFTRGRSGENVVQSS